MASLGGLLFAVGLGLELSAVAAAIRGCRLALILFLNLVVPLLAFGVAWGFGLPAEPAAGMMLLAAAPFAPVVPVFVKLAGGDLALAAGLTAIFPVFAAFLTPLVFDAGLTVLGSESAPRFRYLDLLTTLFLTVSLPLLAGVAFRLWRPRL